MGNFDNLLMSEIDDFGFWIVVKQDTSFYVIQIQLETRTSTFNLYYF